MLLDEFLFGPGHVFRKPCLIASRRLAVFGLNSDACKYYASSGLDICAIILFITVSDYFVPRGTSRIPVFLFLVPLIIYFPFFWTDISCLSIVMVHISLHKTPNDINGAVFIFGKTWTYLDCMLRPGIWCVAICEDSSVPPSGILAVVSFEIIIGAIVGVFFLLGVYLHLSLRLIACCY